MLWQNKCVETKIECLTYYADDECETCSQDLALSVLKGKRICNNFTKISNCLVHKRIDPVTCTTCSPGYYVVDG